MSTKQKIEESTNYGGVSGEKLLHYITQIETLEENKAKLTEDVRELYRYAKNDGFDTKILKKVVRMRKQKLSQIEEEQILTELYYNALQAEEEK